MREGRREGGREGVRDGEVEEKGEGDIGEGGEGGKEGRKEGGRAGGLVLTHISIALVYSGQANIISGARYHRVTTYSVRS